MDLFEQVRNRNKTLSEFLRPSKLEEVVGQKHLIAEGKPFRTLLESDRLSSIILFGPPGIGKTTVSRIYANLTGSPFVQLNAALCGTAELKNAARSSTDRKPIVFLDEIHRFNKAQQDVLLPFIEDGAIRFIGATTYNPLIYIVPALRSRSMIFEFKHVANADITDYIKFLFEKGKLLEYIREELGKKTVETLSTDDKIADYLTLCSNGDIRVLINLLETLLITRTADKNLTGPELMVTAEDIKAIVPEKIAFYDKDQDEHYNTISAFIKSIRGSDANAAVYYLAKMLSGGEDPRFIARRLMIHASEDVGMADPRALQIATDSLLAVEHVGMPEAQIILAHATIYLATAPKSNSAVMAISAAMSYCQTHTDLKIPHYLKGVKVDDRSSGEYKYPHDFPNHYVKQRYVDCDEVFYRPSNMGYEAKVSQFLKEIMNDRPSR